ncbi:MAG: excinuclease ABC subunit UvrA [Patescibacteria group bacterium]|nr:excinuclease ABC subunit UvrA [Patescibacteria group bacterium]
MLHTIRIRGARQHNLQNVNVDIPKNKFVVFTGVSGSGKSSLAFDTIYAEGQRRYVESLSAYARQFLGVMDKPDVDLIEGLSPAISIDQKTVSHNPRSTVGTITEIYDYLRLLFARIGHPTCPKDGTEITKLTVDEITQRMLDRMGEQAAAEPVVPKRYRVLSPIVRSRKGEFKDLFANLQAKGYSKYRVDGREIDANDDIQLIKTNKHSIEVVMDTFSFTHADFTNEIYQSNLRSRLTNLVEQSVQLAEGLVILEGQDGEHLYSENFTCPLCGFTLPEIEPRMFSFNSPLGACETCKGIGTVYKVDPELVINPNLSINEGGLMPFTKFFFQDTWYNRLIKEVADQEDIDLNQPLGKMPKEKIDIILYGTQKQYYVRGTNREGRMTGITENFDGIVNKLQRNYFGSDTAEGGGEEVRRYMREEICDACNGQKLKPEVLSIRIDGQNIAEVCSFSVTDLLEYYEQQLPKKLSGYELQIAKPILKEICSRMKFLKNVGLGYLTISRTAKTLSGGELQRIRLASQIGTGLSGVLYVLDEPSIGLHPRDVSALIKTLHDLKKLGNTLIVVEHDQETIESADYVVELGPKAGKHGGTVIFTGTIDEIKTSDTSMTGPYLAGKQVIDLAPRPIELKRGSIILHKASEHNLKDVSVEFPLGNLIAVTGVSGSGKSTLITETLYPALKQHIDGYYNDHIGHYQRLEGQQYLDRVYLVDQSPIGRTPRSNPATYVGFFDDIREIFANTVDAKARGFQKGRFSFNVKGGRCEKCQGAGVIKIEMQFMADMYITCDVCKGRRYNKETLEVSFKGKSIDEILAMTVDEAAEFFAAHPSIYSKLSFLQHVGLGYITLGQQAPTFSGGEAQRIKLANELSRRATGKTIYILDEPTTGLHFYDIEKLLATLLELVERGNTVVVIEHNLDVIRHAQYIIDMGPEGGSGGGYVMYQGPLEGITRIANSYTGQYLKKHR